LPHPTDDSDRPSTLPRPELNPLLNPLLGKNMGRWAEAYFTSAPKDREQAVLELLGELQAQESVQDKSLTSSDSPRGGVPTSAGSAPETPPELADFVPVRNTEEGRPRSPGKPAPDSKWYPASAGVILVIAIFALAYMAWRSSAAKPVRSLPASVPSVVTQQSSRLAQQRPSTSTPPSTAKTATLAQAPPASNQPVARVQDASGGRAQPGPQTRREESAEPPATPSAESRMRAETPAAVGSDELVIAKSYLNGGNGKARDSQEAAKWLWLAVARHNAEAAGLLADLYLKGEGVPKNCEQARILLNLAARRGVKEAGEQLRHLQAFGCE
jgi:hypothetical protein